MKSCNINYSSRYRETDTHKKSDKQKKLTINYHDKLYLLSYFKPR